MFNMHSTSLICLKNYTFRNRVIGKTSYKLEGGALRLNAPVGERINILFTEGNNSIVSFTEVGVS